MMAPRQHTSENKTNRLQRFRRYCPITRSSSTVPFYSGTVTLNNQPTGADLHVAWRDFRNSTEADSDPNFPGNDPDIYYQLLDMNGDKDGENVKVNTDDTGSPTFDWQTGTSQGSSTRTSLMAGTSSGPMGATTTTAITTFMLRCRKRLPTTT